MVRASGRDEGCLEATSCCSSVMIFPMISSESSLVDLTLASRIVTFLERVAMDFKIFCTSDCPSGIDEDVFTDEDELLLVLSLNLLVSFVC